MKLAVRPIPASRLAKSRGGDGVNLGPKSKVLGDSLNSGRQKPAWSGTERRFTMTIRSSERIGGIRVCGTK